jgi:hypothetical protein
MAAARTVSGVAVFRSNQAVTLPRCNTTIRSLSANSSGISEVINKMAMP